MGVSLFKLYLSLSYCQWCTVKALGARNCLQNVFDFTRIHFSFQFRVEKNNNISTFSVDIELTFF